MDSAQKNPSWQPSKRVVHLRTRCGLGSLIAVWLLHFILPQTVSAQWVSLEFYDDDSREPIAVRMQWTEETKNGPRSGRLLRSGDWFLTTPELTLTPREGDYEFLVQRGPEFTDIRGGFTIEKKSQDIVSVEVPRFTDMHAEEWYSADHSIALPYKEAVRWQRADAVDLISLASLAQPQIDAPDSSDATILEPAVATGDSPNSDSADRDDSDSDSASTPGSRSAERAASRAAGRKETYKRLTETQNPSIVGLQLLGAFDTWNAKHGKVRIHSAAQKESLSQSPQTGSDKGIGATMQTLRSVASQKHAFVELVDLWSRDVPILLSSESIQAAQVLSGVSRPKTDEALLFRPPSKTEIVFARLQRSLGGSKTTFPVLAPYQPRDRVLFKAQRSAGQLSENLYWKILDTGTRLTATAGTDFGYAETHLGYNRTYFHCQRTPTASDWIDAVTMGQTVVTNGPLLRPYVNGYPPGSTQTSFRNLPIPLEFDVALTVREKVRSIDVVFNGSLLYTSELEKHYRQGEFPELEITESGWLLLRVVTEHEKGYRLATSSPFYFVFDDQPRVSRDAVSFMLDWLKNAETNIQADGEADNYQPHIQAAREFWDDKLQRANAP